MKRKLLPFLTLMLCASSLVAQTAFSSSSSSASTSAIQADYSYTTFRQEQSENKRAQGVYFELFGTGLTYSFNYDTRFQNRQDGLGGRVGVSYYAIDGNSLFTLPVSLNYLLGKNGHYFELGAGATFISGTVDDEGEIFFIGSDKAKTVTGNLIFGYRKQPVDGGFLFRAGFAPLIAEGNFIPYWPYVSFGYSF